MRSIFIFFYFSQLLMQAATQFAHQERTIENTENVSSYDIFLFNAFFLLINDVLIRLILLDHKKIAINYYSFELSTRIYRKQFISGTSIEEPNKWITTINLKTKNLKIIFNFYRDSI